MVSRLCWKCERHAHMTIYGQPYVVGGSPYIADLLPLAAFYRCDNCAYPSALIGGEMAGNAPSNATGIAKMNDQLQRDSSQWIPGSAEGQEFPDVPPHIGSAADEANRCYSFDALRASILMARSVIEATCKAKGVSSGNLAAKIDSMSEQGHIRGHTKDAAHEIRYMGNDMAHGDFVNPVSKEDADEMLALMAEVLNEVFQGPARVARAQQARNARRSES